MAVFSAIGASNTATAGLGITCEAIAARMNNPPITAKGPKTPTCVTTASARNLAAPVLSMAMPRGSIPAMRNIAFHSIARYASSIVRQRVNTIKTVPNTAAMAMGNQSMITAKRTIPMISNATGAFRRSGGSWAFSVRTRKSGSRPRSINFVRGPYSSRASPNLSFISRRFDLYALPPRQMARTLSPYFSRKCKLRNVFPTSVVWGERTTSAEPMRADS